MAWDDGANKAYGWKMNFSLTLKYSIADFFLHSIPTDDPTMGKSWIAKSTTTIDSIYDTV